MDYSIDDINSPEDLKNIPEEKLQEFAEQCRQRLIEVVSKSGGHFGPNLGVAELTVALHYVFDSPRDKLIWDVGHQGYIHKMLTGRNKQLESIRKRGGISGFLKRSESEHDIFNAGHASTSISAATGVAEALTRQGKDQEVIAIIGDGSLTGGMAYEGLNNAGGEETDMIVVLNDNGMAIAENVGAINEYFDRLIHMPAYEQVKNNIERVLKIMPKFGKKALRFTRKMEKSVKNLVIPRLMFEEFGFEYFGPVDGHNVPKLLDEFRRVKNSSGPRFVHVMTEKGHGYEPAREDIYAGHATSPFDIKTGKPLKKKKKQLPLWSQRLGQTLAALGDQHRDLNVITGAMKKGTGTVLFEEKHPERFYDVGIAEEHAVTFAGGLATQGEKAAVCIYSTFLQRAYDQIFHDICLMDLPVKFFIDRGGLVGGDGETHQGLFDIAYLRTLPNIVIAAPEDDVAFQHFIKTAVEYDKHPMAVRYPRAHVEHLDPLRVDRLENLQVGCGVRENTGDDIAIIALGSPLPAAREAADKLEADGVGVELINARWAKPLDEDLILEAVRKCRRVITLEEGILRGGFGSAVLELLAEKELTVPVKRLGVPRGIVAHGDREQFLAEFGLSAQGIVKAARSLLD